MNNASRMPNTRHLTPIWTLLFLFMFAPLRADREAVSAFLKKVETAVNRRDEPLMRALTAPQVSNNWRWLTTASDLVEQQKSWKAGLLELPERRGNSTAYVTISKYHPPQTESDRLFPLVQTADAYYLGEEIPVAGTGGYRVRDHRLQVRLNIRTRRASIRNRIMVEKQVNPLPAAIFRINAIYQVTAAKRNGQTVPFRQSGGFLALPAPEGDRAFYDLAYHAKLTGQKEDFILPNEAVMTGYWYPHTGRLPATHQVQITVPRGWTAIGQGERIEKRVTGRETAFTYRNRMPVCFFTIAAGRYRLYSMQSDGRRYAAYLLRNDSARAKQAMTIAARAVEWFSRNFSPYPYSGYTIVESALFPPALECYSFTVANRDLIPIAIVHEVAHTWWGGIVPNTYLNSLWNESLTEFSDGLHVRKTGNTGMHDWTPEMLVTALGQFIKSDTVMNASNAMNSAHSIVGYGKASLVLDQLERMIGTDKMLSILRRFIRRHPAGETAEWTDFFSAVEEVVGKEWRGYFTAWFTRTDLPELRFQNVAYRKEGEQYLVTGEITQVKPGFWLPLPLTIKTKSGEKRVELTIRQDITPFLFTVDSEPEQIAIDPLWTVLRASGKRGLPVTLASLRAANGPFIIVYATGGNPEQNASDKAAAETVTQSLFAFAEVRIEPDSRVTPAMLETSHVLLIGLPENLKLPDVWKRDIPLKYEANTVVRNAKRLTGDSLWGLSIMAHPFREDRLRGHAAGARPKAIRNFRFQGDLEGTQNLFVVRGNGMPVLSERIREPDSTVHYFKP
jgi:hypothetical protein